MPKKVKFVHPAIAQQCICKGADRPHSHIAVVDAEGRLWERFSDMPPGQWGEVERPDAPTASGKTRGRKR